MQALGKPSTKTWKKALCHGTIPIVSWNFLSFHSKAKTFKYLSMILLISIVMVPEGDWRILLNWRFLKIFNDQKLRKVVKNVSSDITWYTIRYMFIVVCKYDIKHCCCFFCDLCGKIYFGMNFLEKFFSKNCFTPVFGMYLMRFRLKFPVMTKGLFSNVTFLSRVLRKPLLNL